MRVIADLHLHSKYSRATSPQMNIRSLALWGKKKGINLLATGDFTHPVYAKEMKDLLVEDGSGFLFLPEEPETKFVINGEISCIYKHKGKTRRLHLLIFVPNFAVADAVRVALNERGCNLKSDGRPIIGLSGKDVLALCLAIDPHIMVIPAHAWTPWFAIFGSKSGYDSLEECFEELTPEIFAVETGLSSDPAMNWRWSALDNITLISNSDAHSPLKVGREANVFELADLTYDELRHVLKTQDKNKFKYTIEFYPEEGKYYYDGHRSCNIVFSPEESKRHNNLCPICHKKLVLGVDNRLVTLADRSDTAMPPNKIPFKSIIPLYEIISEVVGFSVKSKKVMGIYEEMLRKGKNEFHILLDLPINEITKISMQQMAVAIQRMREGNVRKQPGFDGTFGKIRVFD